MPTKDFFLWVALSFMTHRAQPLAAISTEETLELASLYFVFLNTAAAVGTYVLRQKEGTKKSMFLEGIESCPQGEIEAKSKFGFRDSPCLHIPRTGMVTSKTERLSASSCRESRFP